MKFKIQKTNLIISGIVFATFLITGFAFAYRYMWFSTETIPGLRLMVAFAGIVATGFWFGISLTEYRE